MSDAMLTIEGCSNAKTVIDTSAVPVKQENNNGTPNGCYRHKGTWYFNTHSTGGRDGVSEPICKARSGEIMGVCYYLLHFSDTCLSHSYSLYAGIHAQQVGT